MYTAMIFAAGLGTRLKPLTDDRPKALVNFCGKSMLERTVERLESFGFTRIVINIHHFPQLMREAILQLSKPGLELIVSDESDILLDTGGGLKKAFEIIKPKGPVLLHNVDVLSDINFQHMLRTHQQEGAIATLAVSRRETARYFLWDNNRMCGWENIKTGDQILCRVSKNKPSRKAFSGIHIVSPEFANLIEETGKFSITPLYLRLAAQHTIVSYEHNPAFWADLGSIEKLHKAETIYRSSPQTFDPYYYE